MKIRLLVIGLVLSVMLVLVGSTFVERIVSATTDNRNTAQSTMVQISPCANGKESGLPLPSGFLLQLQEFQRNSIISQQRKIQDSKVVRRQKTSRYRTFR